MNEAVGLCGFVLRVAFRDLLLIGLGFWYDTHIWQVCVVRRIY